MRKRMEEPVLKSWDEADAALKEIAEAENQIAILESSLNIASNALKEEFKAKSEPYKAEIKKYEAMVKEFVTEHKADLKGKSRELTFGKVGFRLSTKVVLPKKLDRLIAALRRYEMDDCMEDTAKSEQREAMESDEREGLVREYLDTLLPEKWDDMDLFERRNFLHGDDFGKPDLVGTVRRMSVSNMEIWCECFGKERANLKRMDSGEISAIMARIGGWDSGRKKERISLYGPQWVYRRVPKQE